MYTEEPINFDFSKCRKKSKEEPYSIEANIGNWFFLLLIYIWPVAAYNQVDDLFYMVTHWYEKGNLEMTILKHGEKMDQAVMNAG
jgi:hypothetical protein